MGSVRISGIKTRTELSGVEGFAEGHDGNRVTACLPNGALVKLKPANLGWSVAEAVAAAAAGSAEVAARADPRSRWGSRSRVRSNSQ